MSVRKLTDEDIADILLSDASHREMARRIGCSEANIFYIRSRRSKRAIKAAIDLGLISPRLPPPARLRRPESLRRIIQRVSAE